MKCIFCDVDNIGIDEPAFESRKIVSCYNCKGKYSIAENGWKWIIKYPKWNINYSILLASILAIKAERLRTAHNRSVYASSPSLSSAPWARKTAVGLTALCAVFSSPHFGCLQTQKRGRKNI